MAKGQRIPPDIKEEIINKVRSGILISELATNYRIASTTIYNWLNTDINIEGSNTSNQIIRSSKTNDALTIARLIREKQELTEIIGKFAIQIEKSRSIESKKKLNFRTN
jgi:hypothetical protein